MKKEKIAHGLAILKECTIKYDSLHKKLNATEDKQTPSMSARKSIMDKISSLRLHTRTGSIYEVTNLLNALVHGWENYYCHFIKWKLNDLWRFVNWPLEKWCKWNKRISLRKSSRWLNRLYKMRPSLFAYYSVTLY